MVIVPASSLFLTLVDLLNKLQKDENLFIPTIGLVKIGFDAAILSNLTPSMRDALRGTSSSSLTKQLCHRK
jgi:hypothetical protein